LLLRSLLGVVGKRPRESFRAAAGSGGIVLPEDSGDGFVDLADGTRRWGRFGAAGLLLRHRDEAGIQRYFVAHRSRNSHNGGTWGVPGGARHRQEAPLAAAIREFGEEIGYEPVEFEVVDVFEDEGGGWSYWTWLVEIADRNEGREVLNWENDEVRWVTATELAGLDLFGAFRVTLHRFGVL
jgi:8-oxo-dGTP diphosphatase